MKGDISSTSLWQKSLTVFMDWSPTKKSISINRNMTQVLPAEVFNIQGE